MIQRVIPARPALLLAAVACTVPGLADALHASDGHPRGNCQVAGKLDDRIEPVLVATRTSVPEEDILKTEPHARHSRFQRGTGYIVFSQVMQLDKIDGGRELLYFHRDGPPPPVIFLTSETKPVMTVRPRHMLRVISSDEDIPPISPVILLRGNTVVFGIDEVDTNLGLWFMLAMKLPKLVPVLGGVDRIILTTANKLHQVSHLPIVKYSFILVVGLSLPFRGRGRAMTHPSIYRRFTWTC